MTLCPETQPPAVAAWPPPESHDRAEVVLLEIIMTQHWDIGACPCWICTEGRAIGCRPRSIYLSGVGRERVHVDDRTYRWVAQRRESTAMSSSVQPMRDPHAPRRDDLRDRAAR